MIDLAEEACPALESSSARRLVPVGGGSAQTISHSSLVVLPSVPGPHANLGAGGGDGEGGGEGGGGRLAMPWQQKRRVASQLSEIHLRSRLQYWKATHCAFPLDAPGWPESQ